MLNELIEAKDYKNILNELENQSSKGLYIRVPLDREINVEEDILIINSKDDINAKNEKLFDWFKTRKRYSEILNQKNKEITSTNKIFMRKIRSSHINSIILNSDKIFNIIDSKSGYDNPRQVLIDMIKDFCEYYKNTFAEYLDINFDYDNYYLKAINIIIDNNYININKLVRINIYLDKPIEEYKNLYNKYLDMKLLEGDSKNKLRKCTLFATSNSNKPYVYMSNNVYNNNSAYNTTLDEALKLKDLKQYLTKVYKEEIEYKNGLIKYKSDKGDIIEYEYYPTDVYDIFEKDNLYIKNYKVNTAFKFKCQIDELINISDRKKKIDCVQDTFLKLYDKYYSDINNINIGKFKGQYECIIKYLYNYGEKHTVEEFKLNNILIFNIYTKDYFFNTNIKGAIDVIKEIVINKIIQLDATNEYKIDKDDEFSFLLGEVLGYLTSKAGGDKTKNNLSIKLKANNINIIRVDKIFKNIDVLFEKYGYDVSNRYITIYNSLLKYMITNVNIKLNYYMYKYGLLDLKNVLYIKKNNNEGEM